MLNSTRCSHAAPHAGPRRPGEGVENEEQGIVSADKTAQG